MRLFGLFRPSATVSCADELYRIIVQQARAPEFYCNCGVPDTPDGRYDMIMLHAALVLRRLRRAPQQTKAVSQAVFDLMFADMDQNLREMGVGDLAVGKRIKAMAKAFYGRIAAYDAALTAGDNRELAAALRRNLYRHCTPDPAQVAALTAYLRTEAERLDAVRLEVLLAGRLQFGRPPNRCGEPLDA